MLVWFLLTISWLAGMKLVVEDGMSWVSYRLEFYCYCDYCSCASLSNCLNSSACCSLYSSFGELRSFDDMTCVAVDCRYSMSVWPETKLLKGAFAVSFAVGDGG